MLHWGKNITAANDKLHEIEMETFYKRLIRPKPEHEAKINQLRTLKSIDEKQYRRQKITLPYITCGRFKPPFRQIKNFAAINCFILDIDHVGKSGITLRHLREKLVNDDSLCMLFTSPGNDGLKLLFRLTQTCYDAAKYAMFYKLFAAKFAAQYHLENVLDLTTSDVTRACFIPYDYDAYYNPVALNIDMNAIINFDSGIEIFEAEQQIKQQKKVETPVNVPEKAVLQAEVFAQIRQKLNPKARTKKEKQIFVPEKIENISDKIADLVAEHNILVTKSKNIHYGRQFRFELENCWAELNVFWGQKGFTIVKSSKQGVNNQLTDICHDILAEYLYNLPKNYLNDEQKKTD